MNQKPARHPTKSGRESQQDPPRRFMAEHCRGSSQRFLASPVCSPCTAELVLPMTGSVAAI